MCPCINDSVEGLIVPTGVRLTDGRRQLFEAAERVLLRDGPGGLTSRAVTDEAGCAKGVLHRHFVDFDAFLVDLILNHAVRLEQTADTLRDAVGLGTVDANLTRALIDFFAPLTVAVLPLITFRDELRGRLRHAKPGGGMAVLSDATTAIAAYLAAERDLGRVSDEADIDALTLSLVGGGHLFFLDRDAEPSSPAAIERFVAAALKDV